ncbi:hypothetical protein Tco_1029899 [Tanacetum coccineum]|uniref:Uncharacterized protein n=1 Tax=Tanacetum coccineum TaxID=301880 RepID=A0ABQ5G6A1_9ASTR
MSSSATSDVTYTSVYTDSEPGRAFWGADYEEISEGGIPRVIVLGYDGLPLQPVAPPSPDYILGPENLQILPVPQDEDEQSPGELLESDPEEDPEERYDDDDSSGDDVRDEDEDEEDEEDEEEEEHLAPADSTVIPTDEPVFPPEGMEPIIPPPSTDITIGARITVRPQTSISLPPEAEVERLLTMTTPSPSPSPTHYQPPSAGERPASTRLHLHSSPPLPPSSWCLPKSRHFRIASTPGLIEAVTAWYYHHLTTTTTTNLIQAIHMLSIMGLSAQVYMRRAGDRGLEMLVYRIRGYWVDPAEQSKIVTYDAGEDSRTRDSMNGGGGCLSFPQAWAHSIGLSQGASQELQTHRDHVMHMRPIYPAHQTQIQLQSTLIQTQHQVYETRFQMQHAELAALRETDRRHQDQMVEALRVIRDMRREDERQCMADLLCTWREPQRKQDSQDQRLGFQIPGGFWGR